MNQKRLQLSRRRFLTSIGATAAMLPVLRSLPGYAQSANPTKLILMFSANGRIRHLWGADDSSGSLVFRPNLSKLQPFAQHITVTEGVRNYAAPIIGGTHEGGMMSLFTGSSQGSQSGGAVGHPSIDTTFMSRVSGTARSDSLYQQVVAVLNTAQSASPQNRAIFDASGVPRDPLRSGWEVMEQYMAGAVQGMMGPSAEEIAEGNANTALFASLNAQVGELVPRLCAEDRYQIQGIQDAIVKAGESIDRVVCTLPTLPAKPNVQPWEAIWAPPSPSIDLGQTDNWYRQRSRLAIDLLVAALACGVTRSGVLQYDQAASNALAVGQQEDHHNTSHKVPGLYQFIERIPGNAANNYRETCVDHQADPSQQMQMDFASAWSQLSVWENFYAEEFLYLLQRLEATRVLDDTLIVWCSEIDSGQGHQHYNMPFLLAAGPNIPIQRGKVMRYPISYDGMNASGCIPSNGTSPSHNDLLRTVLQAVGVTVPSVGTAQHNAGVLSNLLA